MFKNRSPEELVTSSDQDVVLPEWVNASTARLIRDFALDAGWRIVFIADRECGCVAPSAWADCVAAVSARGVRLGLLCCCARDGRVLSLRETRMLWSLARSIAREFDRITAQQWLQAAEEQAVRNVIDRPGHVRIVFQQFVDLARMRCVGVEALARFHSQPPDPSGWFAQAHRVGLGVELELHAAHLAVAKLARLPAGVALSINASAELIIDPRFRSLFDREPERIVIEVTEHTPIADDGQVVDVLAELRTRDVRIAVDDAGTGYAGLERLVRLRPDIVKIDQSLIRGVGTDSVRAAMISGLSSFCRSTGSLLLAEGIETAEELTCLRELGVTLGQGYFISRPEPTLEDLTTLPQRVP